MRPWHIIGAVMVATIEASGPVLQSDEFLLWSAERAEAVGRSTYKQGRVGGLFDTRILTTERSYNYKLSATWFTPDVVRGNARLLQLRSRLSAEETRHLVAEAERPGVTVVMVEIDPREGSGVIPENWEAFLGPKDRSDGAVPGKKESHLREVRALAGVLRRNYDYDRFWVTFPLVAEGQPLFSVDDRLAQLVVRIHDKEGRVEWPVPSAMRESR